MNTATRTGLSKLPHTYRECRAFLASKSKMERKRFEKQLRAVLAYGNQVAYDYASAILGHYRTYNTFHSILSKLERLPRQPFAPSNLPDTAKVFYMTVATLESHLLSCGSEMDALCKLLRCTAEQLTAILSIPADDRAIINIWRECLPILQAQYEPMLERISKQLFQKWFIVKQDSDRRDCFGDTGPAICKAVRGYRNSRIKFITYAWHATSREIKRSIYRRFRKTAMTAKLMAEYAATEDRLLTGGLPASSDDVFAAMKLKKSKIDALKRSMKRDFVQDGDLERPLDEVVAARDTADTLPKELLDLIDSVNLKPLERAALEAEEHLRSYFNDENFSDVARRMGYSSQAVADALKKARLKIAMKLLSRVRFTAVERAAFEGRLIGKEFTQIAAATGLAEDSLRRAYVTVRERIHGTLGTVYGLAQ